MCSGLGFKVLGIKGSFKGPLKDSAFRVSGLRGLQGFGFRGV